MFLKSIAHFISQTWIIGLQHYFPSAVCKTNKGHRKMQKNPCETPLELLLMIKAFQSCWST